MSRTSLALALLLAGCSCERPPPTTCQRDSDCDDGLFCSGPPFCSHGYGGNMCRHTSPCAPGERCDEASRSCLPALDGSVSCEDRAPGTACASPGACGDAVCQQELLPVSLPTLRPDGIRGRPLSSVALPGGFCADGCDASRLNDPCGPCAACNNSALAGAVRVPLAVYSTEYGSAGNTGICRPHCTPSRTDTGCPRPGYTCDLETLTCMEACTDDTQCQMTLQDVTGDGNPDFVDLGASYPGYCDSVTGRCRLHGTPGARPGDPCTQDAQCPDDGLCVRAAGADSGVCTRLGCTAPGFECGSGESCDQRNLGAGQSGCLAGCQVGAEDGTPAMLGTGGGNPQCDPSQACVWNGSSMPGDAVTGSCVPGQYNAVRTPNIGAPCTASSDCYSPFGYGVCLFTETGRGMCTVQSCATFLDGAGNQVDGLLPGVTIGSPICDSTGGEVCVNLGGRRGSPETYCLKQCEAPSDCAPGRACAEVAAGSTFCWPYCYGDGDCHAGARCLTQAGDPCMPGTSSGCLCSDG